MAAAAAAAAAASPDLTWFVSALACRAAHVRARATTSSAQRAGAMRAKSGLQAPGRPLAARRAAGDDLKKRSVVSARPDARVKKLVSAWP